MEVTGGGLRKAVYVPAGTLVGLSLIGNGWLLRCVQCGNDRVTNEFEESPR